MGWGGEDVGLLFGCRSLIQALLHITGNVLVFTIHISAIAEDSYSTHCLDCIKEWMWFSVYSSLHWSSALTFMCAAILYCVPVLIRFSRERVVWLKPVPLKLGTVSPGTMAFYPVFAQASEGFCPFKPKARIVIYNDTTANYSTVNHIYSQSCFSWWVEVIVVYWMKDRDCC